MQQHRNDVLPLAAVGRRFEHEPLEVGDVAAWHLASVTNVCASHACPGPHPVHPVVHVFPRSWHCSAQVSTFVVARGKQADHRA